MAYQVTDLMSDVIALVEQRWVCLLYTSDAADE